MKLATVAVAFSAAVLPLDASAQTNGWKGSCANDRMTDKKDCSVIKTVRSAGAAPWVMLFFSLNNGFFGVASGELGARARVRVDANDVLETRECVRLGCILELADSFTLADQLSKGKSARVEFTTVTGRVVGPYEFTTEGFMPEYQRAKSMAAE